MRRARLACTGLLVLLLLLTACGGQPRTRTAGETPSGSPSASFASGLPSPIVDEDGHTLPPGVVPVSKKYSVSKPPRAVFREPDVDGGGKLSLLAKIDPGCVEVGEVVVISLKTAPDVLVSMQTNFPAADGKTAKTDGRSDAAGAFVWRVRVDPRVQPGNVDLLAAAADDKGSKGGRSGSWGFVLAKSGGCTRR